MSIEAALTAFLISNADVQALAGNRVYPLALPQGASFPAITYYRTSQEAVKSFAGLSGLSRATLTVDVWATNYSDAKALADAIRGNRSAQKLDGFRGTIGNVNIESCFCTAEIDLHEKPVHGDERGVYHTALDFEFWYEDIQGAGSPLNLGTPFSAVAGGGVSPGGTTGQVQYNNAGSFGGAAGVVYTPASGSTPNQLTSTGLTTCQITPTAATSASTLTVNNSADPLADASGSAFACITCNIVPQSNFHIGQVYGLNMSIFGFNAAKVDSTYGASFSGGISATNVSSGTLQGDNIWGVFGSSGFNGSGTVTNLYGVEGLANAGGGAGSAVTNLYAISANIGLNGSTTVTNAYGVYVPAPQGTASNATNRYGVYVGYMGTGGHAITTVDASNNVLFNVDTLGQMQAVGVASTIVNKTAAYTLTTGDSFVTADATTAAFAVTLPAANSTIPGREYFVKKKDSSANAVTLTAAGSDKIDGAATFALSAQNKYVHVKSDGSANWWIVGNN